MTKLQVALDVTELKTAKKLAKQATEGGADWIEAGTPLIKSKGLQATQELKKQHPDKKIVADMKTMDTGGLEVEIASKKSADIISILATASDNTIKEANEKASQYGTKIMADLINTEKPIKRAKKLKEIGVDIILVHTGIDQQHAGINPLDTLHRLKKQTKNIDIAVAGGINKKTAPKAAESADIIIVGGAITRSSNPKKTTKQIKKTIQKTKEQQKTKKQQKTTLRQKTKEITTCNLADAQNNKGNIPIKQISGDQAFGKALTVKTMDGDWSKPVQAIDQAQPNNIIVIDASGGKKAVWGELATQSAIQNQINGVIINGAIRDIKEIKKLNFPAWAKHTTPTAGEPKGHGEIGTKIKIENTEIETGDYIYADQNGAITIKQQEIQNTINKAQMIKRNEDRIRNQIKQGTTLSKIINLQNWEKTQ